MVTERADVLRRMDDFLGAGDLHDLVRRELRVTVDMVRGASYSEATGRLLLAAVGELAQLAGWVASDAGLNGQAERYYLGGVSAAHAAQDNPLAANLLSSLACQKANVADPATRYCSPPARTTARRRQQRRPRGRCWSGSRGANARFGDPQATLRALGEVDEAYADTDPRVDPGWVYWLNREEIAVMAGRCLTQLKSPTNAITLLAAAVDSYDDAYARELSLYLSWLAEAHIYDGNLDEAADVAARCLTLSAGSPAPVASNVSACCDACWLRTTAARQSTPSSNGRRSFSAHHDPWTSGDGRERFAAGMPHRDDLGRRPIRLGRPVTALVRSVTVAYAGRRGGTGGHVSIWCCTAGGVRPRALGGRAVTLMTEPARVPNELVRRARLGQASPSVPGQPMSRQELADNVNALVTDGGAVRMDAAYIAKLERGDYRWPGQRYRQALRAVLHAASDDDLGFASPHRP